MAGNTQFLLDTNILLAALISPEVLPPDIQQLALETGFTELPVLSNHCHRITDLPTGRCAMKPRSAGDFKCWAS